MDFGPVAISLRREIVRSYFDDGKQLVDAGGLNTLATNSGLAESRAVILEQALERAGITSLAGQHVLDIGCGFGALALVFACRGAEVLAVDPNDSRFEVGRRVAREHALPVEFRQASMETLDVGEGAFDVAVMNNSLCYVIPWNARRAALGATWRALRPGGLVVIRNPNRLHPRDQFTGLPFVSMLPPRAAQVTTRLMGRHRSEVRLLSRSASLRELRRAGFVEVDSVRRERVSRLRETIAGYQHFVGRRPPA